jgi:hypothetical protein
MRARRPRQLFGLWKGKTERPSYPTASWARIRRSVPSQLRTPNSWIGARSARYKDPANVPLTAEGQPPLLCARRRPSGAGVASGPEATPLRNRVRRGSEPPRGGRQPLWLSLNGWMSAPGRRFRRLDAETGHPRDPERREIQRPLGRVPVGGHGVRGLDDFSFGTFKGGRHEAGDDPILLIDRCHSSSSSLAQCTSGLGTARWQRAAVSIGMPRLTGYVALACRNRHARH